MRKLLLIILLYLFCNSLVVAQSHQYKGEQNKVALHLKKTIPLQENLQLLGKVNDFTVGSDGDIFVVDKQNATIIKYNTKGIQEQIIGKRGRGPFEYLNPSLISNRDDTLYLWDSKQLRFTAITKSGKHLLQLSDFSTAVADIRKYQNYVITYNTGGGHDSIITVYDLKNQKKIKEIGAKTNEHILLMVLKGSGALDIQNGELFYARADDPNLHKINLGDFSQDTYSVTIPDFSVDKVQGSARQIVNTDKKSCLITFRKTAGQWKYMP
ncbi:6-bladed beta-propeller protein [Fodinibius salinus]|uniref:6-bladed beta-propeller protein n=1 Tax=Fodinibius salinus TaxID=860790 RepID=A0A5D3YJ59_9BACT|nr:6-bladed beta-propeller [Fodinibius salinus]TYP93480.1 6-bladed beta-propeller protein [Fodinibius salinus]